MALPLTGVSATRPVELAAKGLAGVTGTISSMLYRVTDLEPEAIETATDIQTNGTLIATLHNEVAISTTEVVTALNTHLVPNNTYIILNRSIVNGDTKWVAIHLVSEPAV